MKTNKRFRAEIDLAREMIEDYARLLARHGLSYQGSRVIPTWRMEARIAFVFVNDDAGIRMGIYYCPALYIKSRTFSVTIENGRGNRIYLDQYLAFHDRGDLTDFFVDRGPTFDLRTFWSRFFVLLGDLCRSDLKNIVSGKAWDDGARDGVDPLGMAGVPRANEEILDYSASDPCLCPFDLAQGCGGQAMHSVSQYERATSGDRLLAEAKPEPAYC